MRPNGCELPALGPQAQVSGRGLIHHLLFRWPGSRSLLTSATASPVRFSELLGASYIMTRWIVPVLIQVFLGAY